MILVGSLHRLTYSLVDAAGAPTNATSVTLTVTPEGGSPSTPTVTNPPATTGSYFYDFPVTQAVRHVVQWVTTGPTSSGGDVFNANNPAVSEQLVGLAEAKDHLNITTTTHDDELRRVIITASGLVERETRYWHRVTVTEHLPPTRVLYLDAYPVVSITSVAQGATVFSASDYTLTAGGGITSSTTGNTPPWMLTTSPAPIDVTAVVGETVVPTPVRDAVLLTVQAIWTAQRGAAEIPSQDQYLDGPPDISYSLPFAAQKLLEPWARTSAIA